MNCGACSAEIASEDVAGEVCLCEGCWEDTLTYMASMDPAGGDDREPEVIYE